MDWFLQRIGTPITAITPQGNEVTVVVINTNHAVWFVEAQKLGWQFKDKVRVHRSLEACVACEG